MTRAMATLGAEFVLSVLLYPCFTDGDWSRPQRQSILPLYHFESMQMRSIARAPAVLIVLTLMLAGCGQKGPLFIPEETPEEKLQPLHLTQFSED